MNQTELNANWVQTILYYCYQTNNNAFFDTWATLCGSWSYDNEQNLFIDQWYLNNEIYNITQPTINNLLSYTVEDVSNFHNNYYVYPDSINNHNIGAYFFANSAELNAIPYTRLTNYDGFRAFDTTLRRVVFWNASANEWQLS